MFSWPLQWARSFGHRFFLQFGMHCATHQIRVILISCVVITSLFYPALDVYASSRTSSQSIVDALLSPNSNPLRTELDLVDLWSGHDTLRVHEDPFTRAKCSNGHALRVERIFIQSQVVEDEGALSRKILLSTYDLEHRIQQLATTADIPCLKNSNGECLVISPLAFWGYDKDALSSDENILDTLGYSKNVSIVGILVTPHMVLAGKGSYEPHVGGDNKFDYATYLVLSFFFPGNDCLGSGSEHSQWIQLVQTATGQSGQVEVLLPGATLIALEHNTDRASSNRGWSVISAFVYLAYIGFFAYVAWSVRRMDAVHSRVGVTFTAFVEIAVSTITSLSVCALVGFKITMVPWEVLPIVIVFVGAENMFNLVDAVGKTSVTLSVKQRIAEGLSRAGTSNTLKVVAYNAILGVIAVFSFGAVRQFCAFAIVVLVAHWFLAHTFFMAVLSIDIARLELEELLRRDTSLVPVPQIRQNGDDARNVKKPRSSLQKVFILKQLLQGRAATNISLLMLLAIAATLYYATYTTSKFAPQPSASSLLQLGATTRSKKTSISPRNGGLLSYPSSSPTLSTADRIWKTLNPAQTPLLHLRLEPPLKVTFHPHADPSTRSASTHHSRYTMRTFRLVLRLLTIMIVPIAATTAMLYGLLLYLLKNTELLEAQRYRLAADDEDEDSSLPYVKNGNERAKKTLEDEVKFSTLPRPFSSDVELVSSSKDGKVIASVGFHNEVVIWNAEMKTFVVKIDAGEIFSRTMGAGLGHGVTLGVMPTTSSLGHPTITCITVDEAGKYLAVGTRAGSIAAWCMESKSGSTDGTFRPLSVMLHPENSTSVVKELRFIEARKKSARNFPPNGISSEPNSPESKSKKGKGKHDSKAIKLLATYSNGMAMKWVICRAKDHPDVVHFSPSGEATVVRAVLLPTLWNGQTFIGLCLSDGTLELAEAENERKFFKPCIFQAGNPHDLVWKVHACQAEIGAITRLVVVAATEAGVISVWDGCTGEHISTLDGAASGKVNQLRISPVHCETCHFCGQLPMESLSLAFSVDHVVRIEKLYVDETNMTTMGTRRCSCSKASMQLQLNAHSLSRVSSMEKLAGGRRSRSNSSPAYSPGGSPRMSRTRLLPAFESSSVVATASAFPISGHGVHSRRASEKDGTTRRSSELLVVPPFPASNMVLNGDPHDGGIDDLAHSNPTPTLPGYSIWRNATVAHLISITSERGGWDTSGHMYKGIRRKSRRHVSSKMTATGCGPQEGLTNATLERWEVWSFDPAIAILRCSSLLSLTPEPSDVAQSSSKKSSPPALRPSSKQNFPASSFSFTPPSPYTTFRALSSSKPGKPPARLPFTRVSPILMSPSHAVAGFGNTIGVLHFAS